MLLIIFYILASHLSFASNISVQTDVKPLSSQAVSQTIEKSIEEKKCERLVVAKDFEEKYSLLKKTIESNFSNGLPHRLKEKLTQLRLEADIISQKVYDLQNNNQEINNIVNDTLTKLDEFIQILPQVVSNIPRLRDQYIVPFANLNSLKAEEQSCLLQARSQASEDLPTNINIYQKLTQELQKMNSNLHQAELASPQKFIIIRSDLVETLSKYNKENRLEDAQSILTMIPMAIHAIQREIENLLPSLQLSQNYYSVTAL